LGVVFLLYAPPESQRRITSTREVNMSTKIFKLAILKRYTEAYYQLYPRGRDGLLKKLDENETSCGRSF
jgi:hypothetical protein